MAVERGKYSFHSRAGSQAQISSQGLTATRNNPLSDFNNAVLIGSQPLKDGKMFEVKIEAKVTSWSGSIAIGCTTSKPETVSLPCSLSGFGQDSWVMHGSVVVKHGRQRLNDYGRDIESLEIGDTVGIARNGRKLNFYVNGIDQGTAEDNLQSTVYPMVDLYGKCTQISIISPELSEGGAGSIVEGALQLHRKCGKLIKISSSGRTARRQNATNEYNNGVIISNRPLKDSEVFEVRITDMIDKWAGSIEIGITALRPENIEIPATMTSLQSQTWIISGSSVISGGKTVKENYGISLDCLKVGDRVGVMRNEGKEFHVIINGADMGPAIADIPKSVYGVIDVYGRCTEVELVQEFSTTTTTMTTATPTTVRLAPPTTISRDHNLCFSHIHGANAIVSADKKNVKRHTPDSEFTESSAFSNRPLRRNELFEISIDKLIDQWSGSLQLGVIATDPERLDFVDLEEVADASGDNVSVWMLSGQDLQRGSEQDEDEDEELSYGLHLDMLPAGSKVGVMVNSHDELHYYLNGQDQGCAFTGVAEGVYAAVDVYGQCVEVSMCYDDYVAATDNATAKPLASSSVSTHQFHSKCGKNVQLSDNCTVARRVDSYNCGIVFSSKSLDNGELFEVRLKSLDKNWSGSLLIGLTSSLPSSISRLPEMATSLENSWIASSVDSSVKGNVKHVKHVNALSKLQEGDRVGVVRNVDATMHLYINSKDMGTVCTGVSGDPYAVVDVYGMTVSVGITSSPSTGAGLKETPADVSVPEEKITYKFGKNICMDGLTATRRDSYNCGIIISDNFLSDNTLFQVEVLKVNSQWSGGLMIGVTQLDPSHAVQLQSALKLKGGTLIANGKAFVVNGNESQDLHSYSLLTAQTGDRVGIVCRPSGVLQLYINGLLKGKLVKEKLPKLRHALVDLYGCCSKVKLLPLEKAPVEKEPPIITKVESDIGMKVKRSILDDAPKPIPRAVAKPVAPVSSVPMSSSFPLGQVVPPSDPLETKSLSASKPPEESYNSLNCSYRKLCERFLKTLTIPEAFFEANPEYNLCYCEECLKGRKDKVIYERGNPPKKYTLPTGWTRFSLRVPPLADATNAFKEWHVAFHGTAPQNVRKILDTGGLVLPGAVTVGGREVAQPKGHFTEGNKPTGFNVQQIFVSPSIKYAGHGCYAKFKSFTDPVSKKDYKCKVAFQVLIKPDSYQVGKETLGYGATVFDAEFKNSEIEWSTNQYGATILYGLLVKTEK